MACIYNVLICYLHALAFFPLFAAHRLIIQFDEVWQTFDNELPVHGVLRNRVIAKPENFQLGAPRQIPYLKQVSNVVLSQVKLRKVLIVLKVF